MVNDFILIDAVIGLQQAGKTGILTVERGDAVKEVYIKNGEMTFATSTQASDMLSEILLRKGRLTGEQLHNVRADMERSGMQEGTVLVKLGYLTPQGLVNIVQQQVEEICSGIFDMEEGRFAFEEKPLPGEQIVSLRLSAVNLIYAAMKKADNLTRAGQELPPDSSVLALSPDVGGLLSDLKLDHAGSRIMSCIDGESPISEVVRLSRLKPVEALKTIHTLMSMKIIHTRKGLPEENLQPSAAEEIIGEKDAEGIDDELRAEVEALHARLTDVGFYGILGLEKGATSAEIKTAYYRAAKKFHPDGHFSRSDHRMNNKLAAIFSYVREAYATLSNPEKRKDYDSAAGSRPSRPLTNAEKAREKFREGGGLLRQGRAADAELALGQAIYLEPEVAEYYHQYGVSLVRQQKFKAAEKAVSQALRMDPSNASYITELGFIFLELGFPTRAGSLFKKALQISPQNAAAAEGLRKAKEREEDG